MFDSFVELTGKYLDGEVSSIFIVKSFSLIVVMLLIDYVFKSKIKPFFKL